MLTANLAAPRHAATMPAVNRRLLRAMELHFHPRDGAAYWLDRARALQLDPRRDVRSVDDLHLLGEMTPADLCARPLLDYIPRGLHQALPEFIIGQTGGTTGPAAASPWTAYREPEFHQAFIRPFQAAAGVVGFPRGGLWLFAGPSGPHIIGKVVRQLAGSVGSPDPFSVDFDPRWARRLPENSFALSRYLEHVIEQCLGILARQPIDVLFTTPAVLRPLAEAMSEAQRLAIRGVHYGGMPLSPGDLALFQADRFPNAVHVAGYGNTLFGCCMELTAAPPPRALEYFPYGARLLFDTVGLDSAGPGRVRFTRLDDSMLIVNMLERDVGELIAPPHDAPPGFELPGIRDPHSPQALVPHHKPGLY